MEKKNPTKNMVFVPPRPPAPCRVQGGGTCPGLATEVMKLSSFCLSFPNDFSLVPLPNRIPLREISFQNSERFGHISKIQTELKEFRRIGRNSKIRPNRVD